MNAREFLAVHGKPDGDETHAPWCGGDLIVMEALCELAADEQRDRSTEAQYLASAARFRAKTAAARTPHTNPPAPAAAPGGAL